MKDIKIAIVEDDHYYNKVLTKYVKTICAEDAYPNHKFEIKTFLTAHDAIEELEDDLNIMFLDYFLHNENEPDVLTGEDVLAEVKKHCPNCKVIMISAQENDPTTGRIIEAGIYEYVNKNVNSKNRVGAILRKVIAEENASK